MFYSILRLTKCKQTQFLTVQFGSCIVIIATQEYEMCITIWYGSSVFSVYVQQLSQLSFWMEETTLKIPHAQMQCLQEHERSWLNVHDARFPYWQDHEMFWPVSLSCSGRSLFKFFYTIA